MNKKMLIRTSITIATLVLLSYASPAFADQIEDFMRNSTGWLVKTIGSGVFALGLAVAGIKIAGGDQGGLRNAVLVMIGGAVIFMAQPAVNILKSMASSIGSVGH